MMISRSVFPHESFQIIKSSLGFLFRIIRLLCCDIWSLSTAHFWVFSSLCIITCASRAYYVAFLSLLSLEMVEKDNDKKVRIETGERGRWCSLVCFVSTKHWCSCCWMSEIWSIRQRPHNLNCKKLLSHKVTSSDNSDKLQETEYW